MGDKEWSEIVTSLRRERDKARAEAKTLRKAVCDLQADAERYRWMKTHRAADGATGIDSWDLFHAYRTTEWDEMIDNAIDAAREDT